MKKVLFILKRREDYNDIAHSPKGLSTGLFNSANFMNLMLQNAGIESEIEVAVDNNCIDRLVTKHKPTHVIIEALWVVPQKFQVLTKLHPNVRWIIRLHSEMPFMAGEGMAMDWLGDYVTYDNIDIGINAPRMMKEVREYLKTSKGWKKGEEKTRIFYLPNYYPKKMKFKEFNYAKDHIDISCFGAIRPLKNHLLQAFAAIKFANSIGKKLRFHVNVGRIEMKGDPILHNLKGLFQHLADAGHELILNEWQDRDDFLKLCRTMDIGMQCNFSETFNIVSADLLSQGVPIISSREIPWAFGLFNAKPTECGEMYRKLALTYLMPSINIKVNQFKLNKYSDKTENIWIERFKG
jgi:hypothetical protein